MFKNEFIAEDPPSRDIPPPCPKCGHEGIESYINEEDVDYVYKCPNCENKVYLKKGIYKYD